MNTFFKTICAGFAAGLAAGCGPASQKPLILRYANFPPSSTFPCVQMDRFVRELETRTNGRVKVHTFPGSVLFGAKEIFDGVVCGTADIGNFAMSYQPGRFPVAEALDLPHFFPDAQTATRVLSATLDHFAPAEFSDVQLLSVFTCPPAVVMSSTPVKKPGDLKGLPVRSSGTGAEVFRRLGGTPVGMPQSETPDALQKGIVKGNLSSPEVLKDMNYAGPCPNVYAADLGVISFAVVMNKRKFNALPEDLQKILLELGREQSQWTAAYVDNHAAEAVAWGERERGVVVTRPTPEDRAAMRAALAPMMRAYADRMARRNIDGQAILDFIAKETP